MLLPEGLTAPPEFPVKVSTTMPGGKKKSLSTPDWDIVILPQ